MVESSEPISGTLVGEYLPTGTTKLTIKPINTVDAMKLKDNQKSIRLQVSWEAINKFASIMEAQPTYRKL